MSNLFAKPFLALLILFVCASASHAQGASAKPSDACLAFKRGLSLGAPLTGIRAKLQSGKALTVVALGSSSTTGFGTGSGGAFPDVMKRELVRLRPSARIELINSGRIMDNIPGNVGRLESDVKKMITDAVKRLKAANTDIVLVDLQYAPLVLVSDRHVRMEKIIAEVAREQNIGLFPRFVLMKRAVDGGVKGLVWWDGLHNSAEGHKCIGVALAQMIDAAAR